MTTDAEQTRVSVQESGLRGDSIGFASLTGQTVAQLGPVASVAVLVGFVAASAGNGSWLTWLLATGTVLIAGFVFSGLTSRMASSGGLASLLAREVGPFPGIAAALGIAVFGLGLAPFLGQVFGVYVHDYLVLVGAIGPGGAGDWLVIAAAVLGFLVSGYLCARDVRLSTKLLLVVELVSLAALLLLLVLATWHTDGSVIDRAQWSLDRVTLNGVVLGLVLAMFTFVTFEGAITFSEEATVAKKTVASAMYGAVAITGGLMVVASYVMTMAFANDGKNVAESTNPLSDLADIAGVHWLSYVLQLGIVVGMFAGGLALTNWLGRLLYSLGRERILPSALGQVHPEHRTPSQAIRVIVVAEVLVFAVLSAFGKAADLTLYSYIGSYFTLLYIFVYLVALVAVSIVAWRRWRARGMSLVAVVPAAVLVLVIYNSVVPRPPYPLDYFTYASLATMVLILVLALLGARSKGGRLARLGSSSVDLL